MATFSVNDQVRRVVATGDGSNDAFDFSFQVNATTDVKVYVDGALKTASSHYNVVNSSNAAGLNTDGTGRIKFTGGNIPANAAIVTILSDVPAARTSVYTAGGTITAASLESDFDTQTMLIGDREERDSRALLAPVNDPTNIDMTLPAKATRAGKALAFNSSTGNPEAIQQVTDASVSVSGLSAGASPTASVSVSNGVAAFALGIPAGATGPQGAQGPQGAAGSNGSDGAAATIAVGSVTTGSPGSSATVVNAGSSSAATFNFTIPQGATGAQGATGPQGPQGPAGSGLADVVSDTSPQLGADLDTNNFDIVTVSNRDLDLAPNGNGKVVVKGNSNPGSIVLNCESNSHGQTVKAQPHSASVTNTLTLPAGSDQEIVGTSATQTLTNKTISGGSISSTTTATTQSAGDSSTKIATTAFATAAVANEATALAIALG